jgi:hypothetical protein
MNKLNLINGKFPEFGNPEHIKFIKEKNRILSGNINFQEIDWQPCKSSGINRLNGTPLFKYVDPDQADAVVDSFNCPRCNHLIYMLTNYDKNDFNSIFQIDRHFEEEGITCTHCNQEFIVEDRLIYCKPKE